MDQAMRPSAVDPTRFATQLRASPRHTRLKVHHLDAKLPLLPGIMSFTASAIRMLDCVGVGEFDSYL